jgi:hypothetical protein
MSARELGFERFQSWLFKHDIVEACTAVKGQMLLYLLGSGADKVVYFDPDIAIFEGVSDIIALLDKYSIVLTPHQIEHNSTRLEILDNEITSLKYGVFNLGFFAVANDSNACKFASWWAQQLYRACYDEVPGGIFTDQKYCDLVPAMFDRVHVHRDPGCNVASWNLSRRHIAINQRGVISANESPLKFYHFTKIGGDGDVMTERYARGNHQVFEIWNWYSRQINEKHTPIIPPQYWKYSAFSNGQTITKQIRVFFRGRVDLMRYFDDPFQTSGDSFYRWLQREEAHLLIEPG